MVKTCTRTVDEEWNIVQQECEGAGGPVEVRKVSVLFFGYWSLLVFMPAKIHGTFTDAHSKTIFDEHLTFKLMVTHLPLVAMGLSFMGQRYGEQLVRDFRGASTSRAERHAHAQGTRSREIEDVEVIETYSWKYLKYGLMVDMVLLFFVVRYPLRMVGCLPTNFDDFRYHGGYSFILTSVLILLLLTGTIINVVCRCWNYRRSRAYCCLYRRSLLALTCDLELLP